MIVIPDITRKITDIVLHCSATKANLDNNITTPCADIGVKEITEWHKARGWSTIGYHFVIRRSGVLEKGRDLQLAGAHVEGHNANSIGICLVGGLDIVNKSENNFCSEQWITLQELVTTLRAKFPKTILMGHREYPNVHKDCPCFDVGTWCNLYHFQKDVR